MNGIHPAKQRLTENIQEFDGIRAGKKKDK